MLDNCLWAPTGRLIHAPERVDYLLLLKLVEQLFSDPQRRYKLFWDTSDTPVQLCSRDRVL